MGGILETMVIVVALLNWKGVVKVPSTALWGAAGVLLFGYVVAGTAAVIKLRRS